jgi:hypothetical protein
MAGMRVALLALLLAGCGGQGMQIDVTLIADSSVTDAMLASTRTLHVDVSGAERYYTDLPLPASRGLLRTERVVYHPTASSGTVDLNFLAEDENGQLLACDNGDLGRHFMLDGNTQSVTLTLGACTGSPPDLGAPSDGGADLAVPVDLAGVDQGPFVGGPSKCPVAGALLCEGWEAGPYPGNWSFGAAPMPSVVGTNPARGSHSLLASLPMASGYQNTGAGTSMGFPHAPPIYLRVFVYVASPRAGWVTTLFNLNQAGGAMQALDVELDASGNLNVATTNVMPGFHNGSALLVPTDQWTCLELMYDATTNGNVKLWMNDTEVTDVAYTGLNLSAPFDELLLLYDINSSGTEPATSVYYDEIVVSTTRVGCAN